MNSLEQEYQDLIFERNRYEEAQAEELLGHEPELLKLYYLRREHYEMLQKLQYRLMFMTGVDNPISRLAMQVSNYQELADRARDIDDLENVANDVTALYDQVIDHLRDLVAEVRQQAAELPPPQSDEVERRLREASSRAFRVASQQYGERLDELRRRILSQSKSS